MVCICLDISINAFCKKIHLDSYYRRGYIRLILFTKVSLYDWTQVYCSLSKLCSTVYLCISPEFGISNYFKFLYLLEEGGGEEALKQSEDSVGCVWSSADVLGSIWWGGGMDFSLLALAHIQLWDSTLNQPCFSSYHFTFTGRFIMFQWLWFLLIFTQQCNYI